MSITRQKTSVQQRLLYIIAKIMIGVLVLSNVLQGTTTNV